LSSVTAPITQQLAAQLASMMFLNAIVSSPVSSEHLMNTTVVQLG
jgi:hypothetical protein